MGKGGGEEARSILAVRNACAAHGDRAADDVDAVSGFLCKTDGDSKGPILVPISRQHYLLDPEKPRCLPNTIAMPLEIPSSADMAAALAKMRRASEWDRENNPGTNPSTHRVSIQDTLRTPARTVRTNAKCYACCTGLYAFVRAKKMSTPPAADHLKLELHTAGEGSRTRHSC